MDPLSKPVRMLYRNVQSEIKLLFFRWQLFRRLYDRDGITLTILERSAAYFFSVLRIDLLDLITLAISRLLEAPVTKDSQNASMQQLADLIGGIDPNLKKKLDIHTANARSNSKGIRDWRRKWSGHRDLGVVLKKQKLGFNRRDVTATLTEMNSFLNEFEKVFQDDAFSSVGGSVEEQLRQSREYDDYRVFEPTDLEHTVFIGDGDSLVEMLAKALEATNNQKVLTKLSYDPLPNRH
jgi:hypothetical protein